ncbi:hypothetical protein L6452_21867 [Arctium lappa]|uniref:Uncharacterized protein n=1 Tax=Arctium lappa TaxID=4217 RepID=A0ACB9AY84_ARCLA|nr:hypothetical protein L6452_21867 [Arctium lappa]
MVREGLFPPPFSSHSYGSEPHKGGGSRLNISAIGFLVHLSLSDLSFQIKEAPPSSSETVNSSSSFKAQFEAYNCLQEAAVAIAFGEQLPILEIVALGGQSDGKSSLLEVVRNGYT